LNLDIADVGGHTGWDLGLSIGPVFADRKYHRYFYSVAPPYATPDRPAYVADGGYSGSHAIAALSKRFPKYWIGAYVRYDSLSSAEFLDSPLVKQNDSIAGGFGIAWMIGESKRLVESE
jgi:outer membrane scaffolding protein for murein synthesis (MipA/OmpV family)